jgi:tetratricopeptide (TPR) repeat protein
VIASRIDILPLAEKRVIQDASVVGRVFWEGAVVRLGGDQVAASLDALVAKGLVRESEVPSIADERELVFNHILTRDVAYASITRTRRAEAHAIVGAWAEETTRGRDEFAEILAFHFEAAGDTARTARYALLAGQRLLRVFAAEEAITWFERARAAAGPDTGVAARADLALGTALEQVGRFADALESYERARSAASGDDELEARVLAAEAHALWLLDRIDEGRARLGPALERARAAGLSDVEARLLYTAGTLHFGRGEFDEARRLHEQALSVAEASGDVEGQALAHHGLCETYFFLAPFELGLEHGRRADRSFSDLGQRLMVAHNAYMVAWILGFLGRLDEGLEVGDDSLRVSHEIGNRRDEAFALFNQSQIRLTRGELDRAWADGEAGRALFQELGVPRGSLVGDLSLADVAAEAADLEEIAARAEAGKAESDAIGGTFMRPPILAFLGWTALAAGQREAAESWFEQARSDDVVLHRARAGRNETLAWEWARDPVGLGSVGRWVDAHPSGSPFWDAWGTYAIALAAFLEDRADEASSGALRVLELSEQSHDRRLRWRAARLAGASLAALGRGEESAVHTKEAAAIVAGFVANASGTIRDRFLARPDVAELLD